MTKECCLNKEEYLDAIEIMKEWTGTKTRAFSLSPYWVHPIRTAALVAKYKQSHAIDSLIIAALFHDIVEDTSHTLAEITTLYGARVASLVEELTSNKAEQDAMGKTQYLSKKISLLSSWALVIKLCDRLDNVSDFCFAPQKFVDKYSKETLAILSYIEIKRDLSDTHKRIIKDIRAMVGIYYQEPDSTVVKMPYFANTSLNLAYEDGKCVENIT